MGQHPFPAVIGKMRDPFAFMAVERCSARRKRPEAGRDRIDHGIAVEIADDRYFDRRGADPFADDTARVFQRHRFQPVFRWNAEARIAIGQDLGDLRPRNGLRGRIQLGDIGRDESLPADQHFRAQAGIAEIGGTELHLQRQVGHGADAAHGKHVRAGIETVGDPATGKDLA